MYRVHDWAEVHRLFHREGWTKTKIAGKLEMSRNTVARLLEGEWTPWRATAAPTDSRTISKSIPVILPMTILSGPRTPPKAH